MAKNMKTELKDLLIAPPFARVLTGYFIGQDGLPQQGISQWNSGKKVTVSLNRAPLAVVHLLGVEEKVAEIETGKGF